MSGAVPAVAVYGEGSRARSLAARIAVASGWAHAGSFATRDDAAAHLAAHTSLTMLLDARCAVDALRCTPDTVASLLHDSAISARAERPGGTPLAMTAAIIARDGARAAGAAARGGAASGPLIGTWISGVAPASTPPLAPDAPRVGAYTHVYGASGYATAGRNLLIGLRRNGVDAVLHPYWGDGELAQLTPPELQAIGELAGPPRRNDPTIVYRPVTHPGGGAFLDRYRDLAIAGPLIACTMFETDGLPARWVPALERCEAVWVPSHAGRETFIAAGVSAHRVHAVPIGIDMARYDPDGPLLTLPGRRTHAFLSVFEWGPRKGADVLLRAWARAFGPDDDVVLYVRTGSAGVDGDAMIAQTLAHCGIDATRCAPIVVLAQTIADADWASLFRSVDAFILPSRGEGFCIPYLEAMALGIPVIGIGYGGSSEFLDAATGFVIDVRLVPVDERFARTVSLYAGQRWAEPDVESTANALRAIIAAPDDAARRAAAGYARARTRFDRDVTGAVAARALAATPPRSAADGGARLHIVAAPLEGSVEGAVARALLLLADTAGVPVSLDADVLDVPSAIDAYDELRVAAGRERERADATLVLGTRAVSGAIHVATHMPIDVDERARLLAAPTVWAPSASVAEGLIAGGVAEARIRIVPLPVDTDRTGPDTWSVFNDPAIVRFVTLVELDRPEWHAAVRAFLAAFTADAPVSLSLLVFEPPSDARAAQIQAGLQAAANGRTSSPPILVIDFPPAAWSRPQALGIHDAVIGPAIGPWPLDGLLASAGVARLDADPEELRIAVSDPRFRSQIQRAARREAIRVNGPAACAQAFTDALDEVVTVTRPRRHAPATGVAAIVIGAPDDAHTAATVAAVDAARALDGSVVAQATFDASLVPAAHAYVARVPTGTWLPFGWDLQLIDALRRRSDADAVAALRSDDARLEPALRAAIADPQRREITVHGFALMHPESPRTAALPEIPLDTVVLARSATWCSGIRRCVVADATIAHAG